MSTEEVTRLAGVGIGTVFRHFPARDDLQDAVLGRRFDRLRERAERLAGSADPGPAQFGMFAEMVTGAPSKIAIAEALVEAGGGAGSGDGVSSGGETSPGSGTRPGRQAERASGELSQAVGVLLRRAHAAGAVRPDVELPELYALLIGMSVPLFTPSSIPRSGPGRWAWCSTGWPAAGGPS
ncbi:MAG: TetR/AcrR family transcriptional regulator, partial [Actinomycetota bacterium]|nr:TetR/AcrR family transcriptional regulator [Actinomycetota bacterium]